MSSVLFGNEEWTTFVSLLILRESFWNTISYRSIWNNLHSIVFKTGNKGSFRIQNLRAERDIKDYLMQTQYEHKISNKSPSNFCMKCRIWHKNLQEMGLHHLPRKSIAYLNGSNCGEEFLTIQSKFDSATVMGCSWICPLEANGTVWIPFLHDILPNTETQLLCLFWVYSSPGQTFLLPLTYLHMACTNGPSPSLLPPLGCCPIYQFPFKLCCPELKIF